MEVEMSDGPVVMLVEDSQDTRLMLRQMLELNGCRVLEAANGQEAIGLLPHNEFDLVLMDLNMPVLDGFTATLRIREYERTRDVPVVAITAYDTEEFRAAAVAVGCCEYIVKPLNFDRLTELLGRLIPTRQKAQAAAQD